MSEKRQVNVRIDDELRSALQAEADKRARSVNYIVTVAIRQYLARLSKPRTEAKAQREASATRRKRRRD